MVRFRGNIAIALIAVMTSSALGAGESISSQGSASGLTLTQFGYWVSRLHPAVVHFPIALVVAALVAEVTSFFMQKENMRSAARYCLVLAVFGGLMAGLTGWLKFWCGPSTGVIDPDTQSHRLAGTISGFWIVLMCIAGFAAKSHPKPWMVWSFRLILLIGVGLVGFAGHLGGALVYGKDYLSFADL